MNDSTALWWVIKGPVVGSIMVSVLGTRREGRDRQREYRRGKMSSVTALSYAVALMHKLLSYSSSVGLGCYSIFNYYEKC